MEADLPLSHLVSGVSNPFKSMPLYMYIHFNDNGRSLQTYMSDPINAYPVYNVFCPSKSTSFVSRLSSKL